MNQLITTTGQASESVSVEYDVDCDGKVQDMTVTFEGIDVTGLLTEDQLEGLKDKCMEAYDLKSAELSVEAAISRSESRRDDACEVMA